MSATSRASAKWRGKKLEENAKEFRAKEALRIRNYRAQAKEKQRRRTLQRRLEDSRVVQDETKLSDDVDKRLYSAVEGNSRISRLERSTHPTPPSRARLSSSNIGNPHNYDEILLTPGPLTRITLQEARSIIASSREILQEWNIRWGAGPSFSHRASKVFLSVGLTEVPVDSVRGEILGIMRRGREALFQLESVARLSEGNEEIASCHLEALRLSQVLGERVTRANVALESSLL